MHYEIDFGTWDTPDKLHQTSTLYIQRGKDGYGKREELKVPESDMFRAELELFAESCRTGKAQRAQRATTAMWRSRWSTPRCARSTESGQQRYASPMSSTTAASQLAERKPQCCLAAISRT